MVKKFRNILIDEKDIMTFLKVVDEIELIQFHTNFHIGRTRWAKAPTAWYASFNVTDKKWYKLLKSLKESGVDLLPETTGY